MSRRRSLAALVLCCPLVLTGCIDAVPDAQQARSYAEGVDGTSGDIRVLNALVVAAENADSGVVSMTIVNRGNQPEQLAAIETNIGTVELSGTQRIQPNGSLPVGAGAGATATIRGIKAGPGQAVRLTLRFRNADSIQLRTVVVPASGEYETITPSPEPSPSPSETLPSPVVSPAES